MPVIIVRVFVADKIVEQLDPDSSFASDIFIMNSSLDDVRYLYRFGEYISENELRTAEYLQEAAGRDNPENGRCLYGRLSEGICAIRVKTCRRNRW